MLSIIKNLQQQKNELIQKIPDLKNCFVDIYCPKWDSEIPFLPIRCFRDFHISLNTEATTFLSSGSTNIIRAQHSFSQNGLNLYAEHACAGFEKFLNRHNLTNVVIISLVPPPSIWPTSSLSYMISMFQRSTVPSMSELIWFSDVNDMTRIPPQSNVIIFGTTWHHLLFIQQINNSKLTQAKNKIFKKLNISIIDTGGTKGKTQAFTDDEIKTIFKNFYGSRNKKFNFFSEYGMCELGSQAWSLKSMHDGTFVANNSLIPLVIDLKKRSVTKNRFGFLGFIDSVNIDSYGAVITEDFGYILSEKNNTFKLLGRAPDASVKGCSLNVANFVFDQNVECESCNDSKFDVLSSRGLTAGSSNSWDTYARFDLQKSFSSLKDEIAKYTPDLHLISSRVLIISAANTPISFLYPLIYCALNGAQELTLKTPSLRTNDFLSVDIRHQIFELFKELAEYFSKTKFFLSSSKSINTNFSQYNSVFAFGTDETLKKLQSQCNSQTHFYGFGDIKNSFVVNSKIHTPKFLAEICSVWNGRGCLTPVCLFVNSDFNFKLIDMFFKYLSTDFNKRFKKYHKIPFHDHQVLFIESELKKLSSGSAVPRILRSQWVTVVDLSLLSEDDFQKIDIDFSFGGQGFVYILPFHTQHHFSQLVCKNIFPKFSEFLEGMDNF